jgi:hypothetical protein
VGLKTGLDDTDRRKFLMLSGLELRALRLRAHFSRYTDCSIPVRIASWNKWLFISVAFDVLTCVLPKVRSCISSLFCFFLSLVMFLLLQFEA